LPEPQGGEVVVRILTSGICGSDVHVWKGQDKRSHLPMILGHEGIGYVYRVNPGKKDFLGQPVNVGDLIVWNRGNSCKNCYECLVKRKPYACKDRWSYGFSKSIYDYPYLNGSYASHMLLAGYTELYRILPADQLVPGHDYVPYVSACCAGTTTACAFEQAQVQSGDNVLIQGPGPLGIYAVLFAKECGAKSVTVIGGTPERLNLCRMAGADHIIDRKVTTPEQRLKMVLDYTDGRGADVVFELAGTSAAVEEGLRYTATCGTYASAGVAVDIGDISVNWFRDIVRKEVRIQGVWVGDMKNTWQAVQLYQRHQEVLNHVISHRLPLEQANEALRLMEQKQAIKVALIP